MSGQNVVRKRLSVGNARARTLDERLALKFPWFLAAIGRLTFRLPATSRLRQALLRRAVSQGFDAVNRRDFAAVLARYHPDVEIRVYRELRGVGDLQPVYRGHEGIRQYYRDWLPAWGDGFRFESRELVDLGGSRLVALVSFVVRGQGSGIELAGRVALLWTLDGQCRVRVEEQYADWEDALAAVGLRE